MRPSPFLTTWTAKVTYACVTAAGETVCETIVTWIPSSQ